MPPTVAAPLSRVLMGGVVNCGAVLCCAVLCCAVLCCAVLCCAVLQDPGPWREPLDRLNSRPCILADKLAVRYHRGGFVV
jgi:hypothetical protein